jgi:hypothetical protein
VHWAKMPISIWNDQDYDNFAIYSGSATIVDGQTVQMYPGLCNTSLPGCPGPINMCIATPADPTDPLQTNWSKSFTGTGVHNPVLPNANRDPSTAWRTAAGEWRFTDAYSEIYGSLDFKEWYRIGAQKHFPGGDCVSFFALPATTPGAGPAPAGAKTYTHVHKASHGCSAERPCQDCMQVCASSTAFCFTNYVGGELRRERCQGARQLDCRARGRHRLGGEFLRQQRWFCVTWLSKMTRGAWFSQISTTLSSSVASTTVRRSVQRAPTLWLACNHCALFSTTPRLGAG